MSGLGALDCQLVGLYSPGPGPAAHWANRAMTHSIFMEQPIGPAPDGSKMVGVLDSGFSGFKYPPKSWLVLIVQILATPL